MGRNWAAQPGGAAGGEANGLGLGPCWGEGAEQTQELFCSGLTLEGVPGSWHSTALGLGGVLRPAYGAGFRYWQNLSPRSSCLNFTQEPLSVPFLPAQTSASCGTCPSMPHSLGQFVCFFQGTNCPLGYLVMRVP